jgi:threonine/homoserine/homoserine lactone efflux protein
MRFRTRGHRTAQLIFLNVFGTQHYWLFLASGILLNVTPGQDTLYIVGRSIAQGRSAGLLSVFGICSGAVVHTLAVAFGLSAVLAASASAFTVIRIAGAAYLVYVGIQMWLERPGRELDRGTREPAGAWAIYRAGLLTNVLNPKVALFYLAFLPQFVDPLARSKLAALLFLGASFVATATVWCVVLALAAAGIGARLRSNASTATVIRRATGALFIGLGVRLAIAE